MVTGEGRFDATSLNGKVVGTVHHMATQLPGPSLALVAGSVALPPPPDVVACADLTRIAGSTAAAKADTPFWLHRAASILAGHITTPRQP